MPGAIHTQTLIFFYRGFFLKLGHLKPHPLKTYGLLPHGKPKAEKSKTNLLLPGTATSQMSALHFKFRLQYRWACTCNLTCIRNLPSCGENRNTFVFGLQIPYTEQVRVVGGRKNAELPKAKLHYKPYCHEKRKQSINQTITAKSKHNDTNRCTPMGVRTIVNRCLYLCAHKLVCVRQTNNNDHPFSQAAGPTRISSTCGLPLYQKTHLAK